MHTIGDTQPRRASPSSFNSHEDPLKLNRRALLRISAIAAAATSLPSWPVFAQNTQPQADAPPPPVRLGLASYSFRNFARTELIAFLKQLNIASLNAKDVKDHLPSTSPHEEQTAIDSYRTAGIQLTAAGTISLKKDDDASLRSAFDYCRRAGISVMVAGDPQPSALKRIERFVQEYDISVAIHNHGPEDPLWHSPLDVLKAVKDLDPRIGCCIDVGHTMRAGIDVVDAIHAAGPRLFDMHIKDLAERDSSESQVAVGRGIMPIPAIFAALRDISYGGFVDLEYEMNPQDPMPAVIESFAYMRGVLAGMDTRHPSKVAPTR